MTRKVSFSPVILHLFILHGFAIVVNEPIFP